jgi:hypothetical protein
LPKGWKEKRRKNRKNDKMDNKSKISNVLLSGYSFESDYPFLHVVTYSPVCVREITSPTSIIVSNPRSGDDLLTFRTGYLVHEAWNVEWAKSDTSTLTPPLPTLTSNMMIPQWTPGQSIRPGQYDRPKPDPRNREAEAHQLLLFSIIGAPIIGTAMLCLCVGCCARKHRKMRRKLRELQRENEHLEQVATELQQRCSTLLELEQRSNTPPPGYQEPDPTTPDAGRTL